MKVKLGTLSALEEVTQESSEVCLIHSNTMGAGEAAKHNCDL